MFWSEPKRPPAASGSRAADRLATHAAWVLRLRWVAAGGQLVTIGASWLLYGVELFLPALAALVGFTALSNLGLAVWLRRGRLSAGGSYLPLGAVMTLDLLLLTALLLLAGGPDNPFIVFYFVNLALAAVVLPTRWSWGLTGVALVSLVLLFNWHVAIPSLRPAAGQQAGLTLFQQGQLVALAACSVVIVYFVTRVTGELRRRDEEIRRAEQQQARSERLEALATLAAGTGHELASPLSTIAVAVKELSRHVVGVDLPSSVAADIALIRGEIDHCRGILDRMAGAAGQAVGEELARVSIAGLVEEILAGVRRRPRIRLAVGEGLSDAQIVVPLRSVGQAVRGVVQNALDASPPEESVDLRIAAEGSDFTIEVRDRGGGMPPETLARAGEPFFTTKEPGMGMGMGLFLTRSVVERLGGSFDLRSAEGRGTIALIRLPADLLAAPANDREILKKVV